VGGGPLDTGSHDDFLPGYRSVVVQVSDDIALLDGIAKLEQLDEPTIPFLFTR
jgi:hypothetical protein